MSRNIGDICCKFCTGRVVLEELFRHITQEEANGYYRNYMNMPVANAHCDDCEAKYLAWGVSTGLVRRIEEYGFFDLSFRSTFNDEPGPADMPKWKVTRGIVLKAPWGEESAPLAGVCEWCGAACLSSRAGCERCMPL